MSNVSKLWRCSTLVKTGHCSIVPGKSILCTSPPSIYSIPRDFPFICTHYTVDLFIELSSFRVIRKHHLINTCKQKSILPAKRRKRYRDLWFSKARTLVTTPFGCREATSSIVFPTIDMDRWFQDSTRSREES